jgi:hypothetical protein
LSGLIGLTGFNGLAILVGLNVLGASITSGGEGSGVGVGSGKGIGVGSGVGEGIGVGSGVGEGIGVGSGVGSGVTGSHTVSHWQIWLLPEATHSERQFVCASLAFDGLSSDRNNRRYLTIELFKFSWFLFNPLVTGSITY